MYLFENYKIIDLAKLIRVHGDPIVLDSRMVRPSYVKFLLLKTGIKSVKNVEDFYYQLAKHFNKQVECFEQYAVLADLSTCFVEQDGNALDFYVDTEKSRNAYLSLREELDDIEFVS